MTDPSNEKVIVRRWRPSINGHHVHVMIYREGRIVASESAASIDKALREARRTASLESRA